MSEATHEFIRCTQCLGVKSYMGLGMIMKDCHVCDQIGYVKKPIDDIAILAEKQLTKSQEKRIAAQSENESQVLRETSKKPTRKKKVA
jgi:hypothetical protein